MSRHIYVYVYIQTFSGVIRPRQEKKVWQVWRRRAEQEWFRWWRCVQQVRVQIFLENEHLFRDTTLTEAWLGHCIFERGGNACFQHLTSYQTTNFRLFQTERVCRWQFQIWRKWQKVIQMGRKHCGKRRNCSLRAISPFPTVFSKGLFPRGVKRCYCVGMG